MNNQKISIGNCNRQRMQEIPTEITTIASSSDFCILYNRICCWLKTSKYPIFFVFAGKLVSRMASDKNCFTNFVIILQKLLRDDCFRKGGLNQKVRPEVGGRLNFFFAHILASAVSKVKRFGNCLLSRSGFSEVYFERCRVETI